MIYLDNNASTRVDPRVTEAMLTMLGELYANPSSMHRFGQAAAARVEEARLAVARTIGAKESEIVFTSGGTEADNAALMGVLAARPGKRHVVISAVEHHAVLETAEHLEHSGCSVTRIGVDQAGRLDLEELEASLRDDTALVSIMLANNETGVIFPIAEVSRIAQRRGIPVHTDAVNSVGKTPVNVGELGVSLLSLSAHKIYGPKGAGALYVRAGTAFRPIQFGGPHERRRRGGTLNAPGIVGLGKACELLTQPESEWRRQAALRDQLERGLRERVGGTHVIGGQAPRVPNTSCLCFEGATAEAIVLLLSEAGVCVSSGAACSSGSLEPSHVLSAMKIDPLIAQGQVRFSVGRFSEEQDVEQALETVPQVVARVRAVSG